MQRTAISMFRQHQPELAESVTDLGFLAGNKINAAVGGASQAFSASCNAVLDSQERVFNDEILSWVNRTGDVVNDTLNMALDEISKGIETTFRGSPLKAPTEDFVNCFITNRIRTVQKAIAWVQGVSHLNLPRVPEGILQIDDTTIRKYTHKMSVDLFGTDAAREQEAAAAGAEARSLRLEERDAASPGEDERGYVNRALDAYEASMAREERFFVYLAAAYGVLFGAGVLRVLHAKTMRRRGPARGWPPPLPREKSSGTAPGAQGRPARPFALSLPSIRPPRRRVARKTDKTGPPQQEVLRSAVPEEGTRALASGLPETPALRSAPLDPPALRPAGLVSTPAHPTGRARAGTKPPEPADRAEAPAAPPLPSDRRRVFGRRPHSPAAEGPGRPSPPQGSTTAAAERIAVAGSRAKEAVRAWWWSVEGLFSAASFGPKDPGEPPPPPRSSETPAVRDVGRRQVALQAPLEPERAAGPAAKSHGGTPGRPRVDPAFGGAGLGAAEPQGRGSTQA
ncbi:MAG: hypothetical protein BJ554DRAFT_3517 [Olpidium bornovanus]|uniref:Plasma membrane fusion protein PRM1 n=1 Tax=Olpidium bornovanus TaxID=278681 RepID=A0A8H8A0L1_9FUNG|nr:MAG: hypothetical protein BJ554DRAFT_3517 [Olpidium bornovanus]